MTDTDPSFRFQDIIVDGPLTRTVFNIEEPEASGGPTLPSVDKAEEDFLREKLFFDTLGSRDLERYRDTYAAIHGQRIVDSDRDLYSTL